MRKPAAIFMCLFTICTWAQQAKKVFFGNAYQNYHNAFLTIDNERKGELIDAFFTEFSSFQAYMTGGHPANYIAFNNDIDTLLGRYFLVERIAKLKDFKPTSTIKDEPIIFVLKDTVTDQDYFYLYNEDLESKFAFYVKPPINYNSEASTEQNAQKTTSKLKKTPVLTGNYKEDVLVVAAQLEEVNKQDYIFKAHLEKYRKSQMTGYTLMLVGTAVSLLSLTAQDNAKAAQGFVLVGGAVALSGFIIALDGHKHLRIE